MTQKVLIEYRTPSTVEHMWFDSLHEAEVHIARANIDLLEGGTLPSTHAFFESCHTALNGSATRLFIDKARHTWQVISPMRLRIRIAEMKRLLEKFEAPPLSDSDEEQVERLVAMMEEDAASSEGSEGDIPF